MSTLTKMALGLMGQLKPQPVSTPADSITQLPKAHISGGLPLMQTLLLRQLHQLHVLQLQLHLLFVEQL